MPEHDYVREDVRATVREELAGFEQRLTVALTKALDIVTGEYSVRLITLEEDQARILRHLGLEDSDG